MFYIEKNDKPNWIEKNMKLVKVENNIIRVPIEKDTKEKQIEKIANKTTRIIQKNSNSKKIVLSKEMQKEQIYINYLNTYGIEISDGKWLFEILLTNIVKYIIEKKKIEKVNISILINDLTDIEIENIKILAREYKTINVVTNHIEKFKNIANQLEENEGIIITVTNNKKKSLMKSQIILNVDFPKELLNKYKINEDAIIVNVRGKIKINQKRFNGLNISDYEINYRDDKKEKQELSNKYFLKDLYEAKLYKKQRIQEIKEMLKVDKVVIAKLILNNGEL